LGTHLTKQLISYGARVFGLDIRTRRKETILTPLDYKKMQAIKGNVANCVFLKELIKDNNIKIVFHLAAEALVGKGYKSPLRAFRSNICGTWSLLEACRLAGGLEAIIVASSDKAYGAHDNLPYKESYPLIGSHPYDVSKSCADLIANTYFHTYGLPVAITRCGNIYGPGDFNFSRLIPDALRSIVLNKTLKIRSDGSFVRDYVYVDDIVAGYIKIAQLLKKRKLSGEAFNLSDEKPLTVIGLLEEIDKLRLCGKKLNYRVMNTCRYEIKKQYLSAAKARRILGWKPRYSVAAGLKKTANWYRDFFTKP
jgi:CDP-glucose 4,6-dehydratase